MDSEIYVGLIFEWGFDVWWPQGGTRSVALSVSVSGPLHFSRQDKEVVYVKGAMGWSLSE
jgi:hypothetical protein